MISSKFALISMLTSVSPVFSQNVRATLTENVTDSSGRSLQRRAGHSSAWQYGRRNERHREITRSSGFAAGTYSATVTYQGFNAFTQSVIVFVQPTRLDAVLSIASAVVDVRSRRKGGEEEAINRTFTAENIINVLPAGVIISLSNANVANAIASAFRHP